MAGEMALLAGRTIACKFLDEFAKRASPMKDMRTLPGLMLAAASAAFMLPADSATKEFI